MAIAVIMKDFVVKEQIFLLDMMIGNLWLFLYITSLFQSFTHLGQENELMKQLWELRKLAQWKYPESYKTSVLRIILQNLIPFYNHKEAFYSIEKLKRFSVLVRGINRQKVKERTKTKANVQNNPQNKFITNAMLLLK